MNINNQLIQMSNSEIQALQYQLIAEQVKRMSDKVGELEDRQDMQEEKLSISEKENASLREVQLKEHRVKEHRFGFVGLSDLGQSYLVSIGSKTMGKLLRLAGLAKQKQSKTEPMRTATLNDYAKSMMYGDYPTYQWNPEKCIEKIDRWLEKEGLIDEFYAIEDETKLANYITEIAKRYGE